MLFLASEADPLNVATEAIIVWSVVVNDALSAIDEPLILATIASLAVDADESVRDEYSQIDSIPVRTGAS